MLKKLFERPSPETIGEPIENSVRTISPVVAVLGTKGGVGTTSIAINLAAALCTSGISTTIVDANFQQPDVANMVGKEPEHSLIELLTRVAHLDRQVFEACLSSIGEVEFGLNLLSPSLDGSAAFKGNLSQLADCLAAVRSYSPFWVLDLPRHIDKHLITLTDKCDKILLVFEATVPGVAACHRWLNIFQELGYDQNKLMCVVNRAGSKYTVVEQQLTDCFGDRPLFRIPNASTVAWECSTSGKPIVLAQPNHKYSQAMLKLAQQINQSFVEVTNV